MKFTVSALVVASLAGFSNAFVTRSTHSVPTALNESTLKAPVLDEVCETTGVTLKRYMNEVAMLNPELNELTTLFGAIDTACKAITNMVKRSQLPSSETLGLEGEVNVQGEDQKKLDVITNEVLKRALRFTGRMGVLASEEEDVPVSRRDCSNCSVPKKKTRFFFEASIFITRMECMNGPLVQKELLYSTSLPI